MCQLSGAKNKGVRATSLSTLTQMVASGLGVTLLPERAALSPPDGVLAVPLAAPAPSREFRLLRDALRPDHQSVGK